MRRGRRDRELEAGARAHFDDPTYYDQAYRRRTEDIAFYRALAAKIRGPILELGCGSGRLLLPIARDGGTIDGLDHTPAMIRALRNRLRSEPREVRERAHVTLGDMRSFSQRRKYRLIFAAFNTLLHLYSENDVASFFGRVRKHLLPQGQLVFDFSLPVLTHLGSDPSKAFARRSLWYPSPADPGRERVRYEERFDYDPIRQILFVAMCFSPARGAGWMTPLAHRQFFPEEMRAWLHRAGFAIQDEWGDFQRGALTKESTTMIVRASVSPRLAS